MLFRSRKKDLLTIAVGAAVTVVAIQMPQLPLIPDIILRSAIITLPFLLAVYFFNLSEEMKKIMDEAMRIIGVSGKR